MTFRTPLDIANRALQHCRYPHISSFNEGSAGAYECGFAYDKVRRAEYRRNTWRFATRRTALRALDLASVILTPNNYAAGTTYQTGAIVAYPSSSAIYWISLTDSNTGNTPGIFPATSGVPLTWEQYFGPLSMDPFNWAGGSTAPTTPTTYRVGELVYIADNAGSYTIYQCTRDGGNLDDAPSPASVDDWEDNILYATGAVVKVGSTNYQSLINWNVNNTPASSPSQWTTTVTNPTVSGSFQSIAGTIATLKFVYPLTSGPLSQTSTRNAFRLPANYLREAPQFPKAGGTAYLGGPSAMTYNDWEFTSNFLVSGRPELIAFRFVADIVDVTQMDDMFCEGLAVRLAREIAPALKADISTRVLTERYREVMGEARTVNGIETGAEEPPEDDWITCRR